MSSFFELAAVETSTLEKLVALAARMLNRSLLA